MNTPLTFPIVLRELTRTHQTFLSYAASRVHTLGLTLSQYDVIITLGNTAGMSFKELGKKTIITKGTLTGVVNRLVDKKLVKRVASDRDGRIQIVRLTEAGEDLFARTFPEHIQFINRLFNDYSPEDIAVFEEILVRFRETVSATRNADRSGELEKGEAPS